ncbi:hypothetical protein [Legionella yabuuchiae]|uniref:hypothetical protein n=1 Tax=Legionella yabuuchiae TaxID=376727 RepID=UPI00105485FC|nr:hypothetical protein [Legionella yabuuchiae]
MSHQLEILKRYSNHDTWFLNGKYPISYKLVILHSFYHIMYTSGCTEEEFKERVTKAWNYIKELPTASFDCDAFSIFRFIDHEEIAGVFLIDHTHSCFPLVFYHREYKSDEGKKLRVSALQKCIFDIKNQHDKLFSLLNNAESWNKSLQDRILSIIPEDKRDDDNF